MSGGPAIGSDGKVYGIDIATFTRVIPKSNDRPEINVNCGVVIHIEYVHNLLKNL